MHWLCMEASGTGNIAQIDRRMVFTKYQLLILEANVKLKLKRGWLLQQDNDAKHFLETITNYFKKCKLKLLEWPSQSPDLKIIENVWADMCMQDKPKIMTKLEVFCKEEAVKIPTKRKEKPWLANKNIYKPTLLP